MVGQRDMCLEDMQMDVQPPPANGTGPTLGLLPPDAGMVRCCSLPAGETPNLPMEKSELCVCLLGQQGFVELPRWQLLLLPRTKRGVCAAPSTQSH